MLMWKIFFSYQFVGGLECIVSLVFFVDIIFDIKYYIKENVEWGWQGSGEIATVFFCTFYMKEVVGSYRLFLFC